MRLDEFIDGIDIIDMGNLFPDMEITSVTADSRNVMPGSAFFAVAGDAADGHQFIDQALENGATVVFQEQPLDPARVGSFIRVADSRKSYALTAAQLHGWPSRDLQVIGITGTNGKTSTVLMAQYLLETAGIECAALGTLGLRRSGSTEFVDRGLTTPDAGDLQQLMADLVNDGTSHLIMEVSSHAIAQERIAGVEFAGAVFTNITQDHFDYHGNFESYRQTKEQLFTSHLVDSGGFAVINADDPVGLEIAKRCPGVLVTYGRSGESNLVISDIESTVDGLTCNIVIKNGVWPDSLDLNTNLMQMKLAMAGTHNSYNAAAAAGIGFLGGLNLQQVSLGIAGFPGVPGRLERVEAGEITCFVDYAHTPDALANVLTALAELRNKDQKLITVIGCGGDRDKSKRSIMGGTAMELSDLVIITSDNPRSEDPEAIIDDIMKGIDESTGNCIREQDRRKAIELAIGTAVPGDIVLVAGKGHEDYQILGDQTIHFSDAEEIGRIGAELGRL